MESLYSAEIKERNQRKRRMRAAQQATTSGRLRLITNHVSGKDQADSACFHGSNVGCMKIRPGPELF